MVEIKEDNTAKIQKVIDVHKNQVAKIILLLDLLGRLSNEELDKIYKDRVEELCERGF